MAMGCYQSNNEIEITEEETGDVDLIMDQRGVTLNYYVKNAPKRNCTFTWLGNRGYMEAVDGRTKYTNRFKKEVPSSLKDKLGRPRTNREGAYFLVRMNPLNEDDKVTMMACVKGN